MEVCCIGGICVLLTPCPLEVEGFESRNTVCIPVEARRSTLWPGANMLGRLNGRATGRGMLAASLSRDALRQDRELL